MIDETLQAAQDNATSSVHRCKHCRGETRFDAKLQRMLCLHCGQTATAGGRGDKIKLYDVDKGLAGAETLGYGLSSRTAKCGECGALVHFGAKRIANRCAFCGSPQVLELKTSRQVIKPESLIPFRIDEAGATQALAGWLHSLRFRPSDLLREARVGRLTGVYVPYWSFAAKAHSDWTAEAGYHYYETETYTETNAQGETETKTREVQRTRWEPASGSREDKEEDLLVCASAGAREQLLPLAESFETKLLVPYAPEYLVGWVAEEYSVELATAWLQAKDSIESSQHVRCSRDVPGHEQRRLSVTTVIKAPQFRHVLLPIWVSAYRYRGKIYRFLINGQTGRLSAEAPPYSVLKLSLLAAAVFIVIMALSVLVWSFFETKPPSDSQRPVHPFSTPEWKAFEEKAREDIQQLREQRDREH